MLPTPVSFVPIKVKLPALVPTKVLVEPPNSCRIGLLLIVITPAVELDVDGRLRSPTMVMELIPTRLLLLSIVAGAGDSFIVSPEVPSKRAIALVTAVTGPVTKLPPVAA